jgi:hypothetical protein
MYHLTPSLEQRFKLYLNILPVVEQAAMYVMFFTGSCLILLTIYILTFKVMFKTFDQKRHRNIVIASDIWIEREGKRNKDSIYTACEIPLNETESDSDVQVDTERRPSLLKIHSERIKELGHKIHDSVGSVKDLVRDELANVKHMFSDRKNSLIRTDESNTNDAYKSDSGEEEANGYCKVEQADSDDDCKYLEVLDDGSEFDCDVSYGSEMGRKLSELDSNVDELLHISD